MRKRYGQGWADPVSSLIPERNRVLSMREVMTDLAELLKSVREGHGLSQDALAQRLGVTQATVSRYESGGITLGKIQDWADALGHELTAVPSDHAELVAALVVAIATLDETQRETLVRVLTHFVGAPAWAQATAAEVLQQSVPKVVTKGA